MAGFADSRHADTALFLIAFAESSFFPVPPDVLLLALAFAQPRRAFRYAVICTIGSVLGGAFGYLIGSLLLRSAIVEIVAWVGLAEEFARAGVLYQEYDVWAVFIAAFTVIPFKVFTILAGLFHLDFWRFMLASLAGRGLRFFVVAAAVYLLGPRIKPWVERYLEWVALAFAILLVGGFMVLGRIGGAGVAPTPADARRWIGALSSDDLEARKDAIRSLREGTHGFFGYDPTGPEEERRASILRWIEWYDSEYPDAPPVDGPQEGEDEAR